MHNLCGFLGDPLQNGSLCAIGPLSCLSVLSVTLVYCGQTVGWIKIPRATEVGLGPGHIVLDGDPAAPWKGHSSLPHFRNLRMQASPINRGPCLLWSSGWMDQDATWYEGRTQTRQHCVRRRPSSPRNGAQQSPLS